MKFLFNVGEKNKRVNSGGGGSIQNATALRVKKCKQADDEILFILFFFSVGFKKCVCLMVIKRTMSTTEFVERALMFLKQNHQHPGVTL